MAQDTLSKELKLKKRKRDAKLQKKGAETKFKQLKSSLKVAKNADKLAKGAESLGHVLKASHHFKSFADGGDTMEAVRGGLAVASAIATVVPAPIGVPLAAVTGIISIFVGGGEESTTEVMKQEFADLKENIGQQFEAHRNFTVELMTVVTERLEEKIDVVGDICLETGKTTLEQIAKTEDKLATFIWDTSSTMTKATVKQVQEMETQMEFDRLKYKALGLLDALEVRFDFIYSYRGVEKCLKDPMAAEITGRVEYFMDQAEVFNIKNVFSLNCKNIFFTLRMNNGHLDSCFFLLYTYVILEQKRHEILLLMINLLANSIDVNLLNAGYLSIQKIQKDETFKWLEKAVDKDVYCALMDGYNYNNHRANSFEVSRLKVALQFFGYPMLSMESDCKQSCKLYFTNNFISVRSTYH